MSGNILITFEHMNNLLISLPEILADKFSCRIFTICKAQLVSNLEIVTVHITLPPTVYWPFHPVHTSEELPSEMWVYIVGSVRLGQSVLLELFWKVLLLLLQRKCQTLGEQTSFKWVQALIELNVTPDTDIGLHVVFWTLKNNLISFRIASKSIIYSLSICCIVSTGVKV